MLKLSVLEPDQVWWGGRAAMRSPAEDRIYAASEFIGVRIPSPPLNLSSKKRGKKSRKKKRGN
jgi:hypothetical protein